MQLTQHFSLDEFTASETAARRGIDNTPNAEQIEKLRYLAQRLEEVRDLVGALHVNSGYRCPKLNAAIGSKPSSQHIKCEAADLISLNWLTPIQLCRAIETSGVAFDQMIYEFDSWMHISFVEENPRWNVLTINKSGTKAGLP